MANEISSLMTSSRELSDVTLGNKDESNLAAHCSDPVIKSEDLDNGDTKQDIEIKTEINKEEDVSKIKVKYALNKVKNLEVAKLNAERPIKISRFITDDQNIRYEINSGQYLHIKEEMNRYRKTESETSENGEVTITVERNSSVEDTDQNNPETQIKMSVTNNNTNETTKVVIKMYHTNQSIHLQGGRRMGKVTSTMLLADCLEKQWTKNMNENIDSIKEANSKIKGMVIKPGMGTRARTSTGDPTLPCDQCSYTCNLRHQLNTHKISKHGVPVRSVKFNGIKRKSPPNKSPEIKRAAKGILKTKEESKRVFMEHKEHNHVKMYACPECAFVYKSEYDLTVHISVMHAPMKLLPAASQQPGRGLASVKPGGLLGLTGAPAQVLAGGQQPGGVLGLTGAPAQEPHKEATGEKGKNDIRPITMSEVDKIIENMAKEEVRRKNEKEVEEFLDIEKDRLHTEAENWRKTAQDLDLDLKSALKSNEKLVKDQLGVKEDYQKVTHVAGELQNRVHNLEEEIKEMKVKMELDIQAKDKAEIELETLKADLDQEGIPKCPICRKWFPNIDVITGHMDIVHGQNGQNKIVNATSNSVLTHRTDTVTIVPPKQNTTMENSGDSGYGSTEQYQLVSVQCKKCDETLENNHLLRIHMRKHVRKEQEILKCTNCEYETAEENQYMEHIVDNHSTFHICQVCQNRFPTKQELIAHIVRQHCPQSTVTAPIVAEKDSNQIKCYDCGEKVSNREDLMKHKKDKHWKQKPCPYWHRNGRGCRFPTMCASTSTGQKSSSKPRECQGRR